TRLGELTTGFDIPPTMALDAMNEEENALRALDGKKTIGNRLTVFRNQLPNFLCIRSTCRNGTNPCPDHQ
ncbi:MAG: hypothetical protein KC994_04610, partial [Candidatus Omnitrophica bacterium]|nr:hypothetical protein [Candidatus Omnitrophota bacterium]